MTGAEIMEFTVNKEWLVQQLDNELVKIVDCRFEMGNPELGKKQYEESHIPGAVYFDIEKDLSGPVQKHGGRHPLPDIEILRDKLESVGITRETTVVAYDSGTCENAARLWWLLSYLGHERVFVLDGGYEAWMNCEFPTDNQTPSFDTSEFEIYLQTNMLADYQEVREVVEGLQPDTVLMDSRAKERYLGIEEPIDSVAGHIPGAVNYPWKHNFQDDHFKKIKNQQERFHELPLYTPIIVYCGSGITATPNYLGLRQAGYQNVKLYAGSYSDWISYEDSPINKT